MRKLKWILPAAVMVVVAAGVASYLLFFRDRWQPPTVVVIESEKMVSAMFPSYMVWQTDPEEDGRQALLLRDGDHFVSDGHDAWVRYLSSDGATLQLAAEDWGLTLNGDVVSISVSEVEALAWLDGATDEKLAKVRSVRVPDDISPEQLAALNRLAAINPQVDLTVQPAQVLPSLLDRFQPRAIFMDETTEYPLTVLSGQPELETLVINASEPGSLDYLPKLPRLRRLVLREWDPEETGPLPAGLDGLKSLIIVESKHADISALQAAPAGLEELTIWPGDELLSLEGIERMSNLHTLILAMGETDSTPPLPDMAALRKLRWIGLPQGLTQPQLEAVVKSQPDVAILELLETEKPLDLAPLRRLKNLYGLVLGGTYEDLDVVQTLKSLHFLGISDDSWPESPEKVAEIRAALPDAVVIHIEPICLGSGWLLLFLPLLGLVWLRHERHDPPARAA